jgi:PPOX class probable F420-dependent enzyme
MTSKAEQRPAVSLPETARRLIESGPLAHLATVNPDGSPHLTGVWVGLDGDDLVFASMYAWRKTKNLWREPRCAVSMQGPDFHASGLREYLVLRGSVTVEQGHAFALLRRLAAVYMGPGTEFPPDELSALGGYVMRMRVERIGGVGPWTGAPPGLPEDAARD